MKNNFNPMKTKARKFPTEAVEDVILNCFNGKQDNYFAAKHGMSRQYVCNLRRGKVCLDVRIRLVEEGRLIVCPACGGRCRPEKQKLICNKCNRIVETCCE